MADPLDTLRELVLGDPDLFRSLDRITDRLEFSRTVAAVARQHGVSVDADDVDRSLVAAHRGWLERWV